MIQKGNYTDFEILPNGDLKITLNPEGKIELTETQEQYKDSWNDFDLFYNIIDYHLCNGWTRLYPEDVGALTESPILSQDVSYNDNGDIETVGDIFWYPNYQVENLAEKLLENGYLIFSKGE